MRARAARTFTHDKHSHVRQLQCPMMAPNMVSFASSTRRWFILNMAPDESITSMFVMVYGPCILHAAWIPAYIADVFRYVFSRRSSQILRRTIATQYPTIAQRIQTCKTTRHVMVKQVVQVLGLAGYTPFVPRKIRSHVSRLAGSAVVCIMARSLARAVGNSMHKQRPSLGIHSMSTRC